MRKVFLSLTLLSFSQFLFAQATDIGIDFKKKGFIRDINYSTGEAIVDFITEEEISTEKLLVPSQCKLELNKNNAKVADLHAGMSVTVEGEFFRKKNISSAKKVIQTKDYDRKIKIEDGRIDLIQGDYALVDGKRIKLRSGTTIKGVNGYKKNFNSLTELMHGDIANVQGFYEDDGNIYATSFTVEPDEESLADEKVKEEIKKYHDILYPIWTDKEKRKQLYGQKLFGSTITNNETLQNYVTEIGNKLVPDHLKTPDSKLKFIFIVIDNPEWNAFVLPNGLSCVNMGLLTTLENDAQLAAVLGHEISHAIYEHGAKRFADVEKAKKSEERRGKLKGLLEKVVPRVPIKNPLGNGPVKIDKQTSNVLLNDLPGSILQKKLSDYSVDEESQADRAGLALMVNAGYDPREATTVWRDVFNRNPSQPVKSTTYFENSVDDLSKVKKTSTSTVAIELLKSVAKTKAGRNLADAKKTHPDNLKRFTHLHEMIDMFWAYNGGIEKSSTGFDNWLTTWKKVIEDEKKKP